MDDEKILQAFLNAELRIKGHIILDEVYWNIWDELSFLYLKKANKVLEIEACLECIEALNNDALLGEADNIITKQKYSEASRTLIMSMVAVLCDRGQVFYETYYLHQLRSEKNNG